MVPNWLAAREMRDMFIEECRQPHRQEEAEGDSQPDVLFFPPEHNLDGGSFTVTMMGVFVVGVIIVAMVESSR